VAASASLSPDSLPARSGGARIARIVIRTCL
jgi:hypothetical protein